MKGDKSKEYLVELAGKSEEFAKKFRKVITEIEELQKALEVKKSENRELQNRIYALLELFGKAKQERIGEAEEDGDE